MSDPHKIDYLLDEIITLPSQPQTLARITKLVDDSDCSLADVAKVISADPSIALKSLRLVNSAHYGLRNKVVSVEHAVMLLGLKVIRNLVLTATVFETFAKGATSLLHHSVACGVAMRVVVETRDIELPGDAEDTFVYGLLHDIGKIVFQEFLPEDTAIALELSSTRGLSTFQAEQEVIGCDHAELGARLAQKWMLPAQLVAAIAGHHDLDRCEDADSRELSALLAVSDYICWCCGLVSAPGASIDVDDSVWESAKLTSRQIPAMLDAFFGVFHEVRELTQLA